MGLQVVGPVLGEERMPAFARQVQEAFSIDRPGLTGGGNHRGARFPA